MLEPTQDRLNGSGPERSLANGAGLGSEWRTVLSGSRTPAEASPGTRDQFPEARGNCSAPKATTPAEPQESGAGSFSDENLHAIRSSYFNPARPLPVIAPEDRQ